VLSLKTLGGIVKRSLAMASPESDGIIAKAFALTLPPGEQLPVVLNA
jgi:hypothetical protein